MKTKIKIIVASLALVIGINQNTQAGTLVNPLTFSLTVAGLIALSQTIPVLTKSLSDNLNDVEDYFALHPEKLHPVENYLNSLLAQPQARSRYEHYKKLAEVLGMENIPPYAGEPQNKPINNINVQHNLGSTNNVHPNSSGQVPDKIIYSPQGEPIDVSTEFPLEHIQTWEDYLSVEQASVELAKNMADAGMGQKQPGYAAHHIVPYSLWAKNETIKEILKSSGIEINGAQNGVYLPTKIENEQLAKNKKPPVPGITHTGRHPNIYSDYVEQRIITAYNNNQAIGVQQEIDFMRQLLANVPNDTKWSDVLAP